MRKLTNTLSPSPKGFQSPKFSDSGFREVRGLGFRLWRPKSSAGRSEFEDCKEKERLRDLDYNVPRAA
jgi:hypothetical protein